MKERESTKTAGNGENGQKQIYLAGNIKVGKSTLFSGLADGRYHEIHSTDSPISYNQTSLKGSGDLLIDPPGISSIFVQSEDEQVSRNLLIKERIDNVIIVLDAANMVRSVTLALQFAEFGIPMVFAVNMDDVAQSKGITIDTEKLSLLFGVKVIRTVAREKQGIAALKEALAYFSLPKKLIDLPEDIEAVLSRLVKPLEGRGLSPRMLALLLLNKDLSVERLVAEEFGESTLEKCRKIIQDFTSSRLRHPSLLLPEIFAYHANRLVPELLHQEAYRRTPFMTGLGRRSMSLTFGIPIAFLVAAFMYLFVGKFGAEFLVGIMEGRLFGQLIVPSIERWLAALNSHLVTDFFCGEFGVISVGLNLAFGLLLPVLLTFNIFFGLLEDSGYLPRLSILLDRLFRKMGLNGKGVLPLIMGFSCITMAVITTRMLDSKKEKIIATLLLMAGIPCAPLLSVMFVIFAKLHWTAIFTVFGILAFNVFIMGVLANTFISGKRGDFILEIPMLRIPGLFPILKRAGTRLYAFMREAVPIFVLGSIILFVFDKLGGLDFVRRASLPIVQGLMGLPGQSVDVFIMTVLRREAGAALLDRFFDHEIFNGVQAVVILIVMTTLMPCINAIIVIFKERGIRVSLVIMAVAVFYALFMGTFLNWFFTSAGIVF